MTINLTVPLAWTKASAEELQMLQALQDNVLKVHDRDYTENLFFKLDPAKQHEAEQMLRQLANEKLTSAHRHLIDAKRFKATGQDGGPSVHLALTFKGHQTLGLAASAPADLDFQARMKAPASVSALSASAVTSWEAPFRLDLHGVILAAGDTESETAALAISIKNLPPLNASRWTVPPCCCPSPNGVSAWRRRLQPRSTTLRPYPRVVDRIRVCDKFDADVRRFAMAARAELGQKAKRSPAKVTVRPLGGESAMNVEYLLVTFSGHRTVLADGTPIGVTNHILMLPPGGYDITLDGDPTKPPDKQIDLLGTSLVRPMTVSFT